MAGVGVDGAGAGVNGATATTFNPAVLYQSVDGGWAQLAWNFQKINTLAIKYETMSEDPLYPQYGRRSAWDLGILRWLDDRNRVKIYYIINTEQTKGFSNNDIIAEWISIF